MLIYKIVTYDNKKPRFTSKVLIYTDESPRAFTSEVRCSGKLAEMGAAELAYKALAEYVYMQIT